MGKARLKQGESEEKLSRTEEPGGQRRSTKVTG